MWESLALARLTKSTAAARPLSSPLLCTWDPGGCFFGGRLSGMGRGRRRRRSRRRANGAQKLF